MTPPEPPASVVETMIGLPAAPYGDTLVDRIVGAAALDTMCAGASCSVRLGHEAMIHLANLATGCYSPLDGFMTEEVYESVVNRTVLPAGFGWTIPIQLHVANEDAATVRPGDTVALCDADGVSVGALTAESIFAVDAERHCARVFGTNAPEHPGVQDMHRKPPLCIGGPVQAAAERLSAFRHRHTPTEMRARLASTGKSTAAAFSTRNICHIGHEHLHRIALARTDLLGINVITGAQLKGNFVSDVVFDTYENLIERHYPPGRVFLNNLRLPPIYAGPKEAFLQATVLQNLGFTHFIVGRDHAGIGSFYPKYGSQAIFREVGGLSIEIMAIPEPRWCPRCNTVTTEERCACGGPLHELNGRDVRRLLLEKRYDELQSILDGDMLRIVIDMFEERATTEQDVVRMREIRPVFYD